jgi:CRISPR/Cas system-associated exonuclease Cas4 (RecB family)|tara:strand:+ start:1498 stop:2256 length:759 start_codon:yes stop_codon:yes gene_type:complete
MIDIESIYESFLQQESKKIQLRYKGVEDWFGASSAGQCYRKQWYRANKYEPTPPDKRVNRLLRLGTIVHADFENAITSLKKLGYLDDISPEKSEWITEYQINLPVLKVVGHLDMALIDHEESKAYLWDIKTVHSFKWKKQFGHMKNRDPNPSVNYELQLGTYAMGLANDYEVDDVEMNLIWYNKDTSSLKTKRINENFVDEAMIYWTDLIESLEDIIEPEELKPGITPGVPVQEWECKYCQFAKHCDSPFKK